jgi:hypothetical protein
MEGKITEISEYKEVMEYKFRHITESMEWLR